VNHGRLGKSYALSTLLALLLSCGSREGDPPSALGVPPPGGRGHRIHEIGDPASPLKAADKDAVAVTGAVVVAVDTYDETHDGKSAGTIYVADLGSQEPYSGISLYQPSFNPSTLRVGAGDVIDLTGGLYEENTTLPVPFAPGSFLVQIATPIATLRFDGRPDNPLVPTKIDVAELANFDTGRKWLNMLVTVENVTIYSDATGTKRISAGLQPDSGPGQQPACTDPFPKVPALVNELMDLNALALTKGTVIKSLTGVVTFFCNLHIAPRSAADIVR
jgi:hypothetical protein